MNPIQNRERNQNIKNECMNWGNRLLLVFIVFAGGMSYMVYRCMQSPVVLADKEYYKNELAYQQVIDGTNKANALSMPVRLNSAENKIIVEFPPEMRDLPLNGHVLFYCAADESKDRNVKLDISGGGRLEIDRKLLVPGYYTVKITWRSGSNDYYAEQPFSVL
jgi:nitrogen fixation protein FixH